MSDILPFRPPKLAAQHRGKTLCRSGFHKWAIDQSTGFDVKQGRLVTVQRCVRCGARKHTLR